MLNIYYVTLGKIKGGHTLPLPYLFTQWRVFVHFFIDQSIIFYRILLSSNTLLDVLNEIVDV